MILPGKNPLTFNMNTNKKWVNCVQIFTSFGCSFIVENLENCYSLCKAVLKLMTFWQERFDCYIKMSRLFFSLKCWFLNLEVFHPTWHRTLHSSEVKPETIVNNLYFKKSPVATCVQHNTVNIFLLRCNKGLFLHHTDCWCLQWFDDGNRFMTKTQDI